MPVDPKVLSSIITDPEGAELLVETADNLGKQLKESGLTTSQIRALFGEVRQIQAQWSLPGEQNARQARRRLILLKPKMRYRARKERERGKAVSELVGVLEPAVDLVVAEKSPEKQKERFDRFVEFFEAILAYHKAYGGN